jgi:hypothetical protein
MSESGQSRRSDCAPITSVLPNLPTPVTTRPSQPPSADLVTDDLSRGSSALTGSADIKLNERCSLRRRKDRIRYHTEHFPDHRLPDHHRKAFGRTFSGRWSCLKTGFDFMIRYSAYRGTNYRTNSSASTNFLHSLETEYRELQDLRERVRKAEAAAAKRLGLRGRGHLQNSDQVCCRSKE